LRRAQRAKLRVYERRRIARSVSGTRELRDSSRQFIPALDWLGGSGGDARGNAERRAEDLVRLNRGLLQHLRVDAEVGRVRGEPGLHLSTGVRVGAIPLRSPVTGRADFGLIINPRFPWSGLGDVLAHTGFRIVPDLLPLPELPHSERRIPPWVLTSVVLQRLERLLEATARRFETVEADLRAPRGTVDWAAYATRRFPVGRALDVPCSFPDLRDDEQLRSAIHWTVRRHREALLAAPAGGLVVRQLLAVCERLLAHLAGSPPQPPDARLRAAWHRLPFSPAAFKEGLDAIDWTVDERGLAGLSDLAGLSWRLDMDVFFEAWLETAAAWAATRTGATLRSGRTEQTRVPLDWSPPGAGSQRSLLPDVVLSRPDVVVVLDAKYKQHAEEIDRLGWRAASDRLREQHRDDLLQALAYSTLFDAPRVVTLLAYPCGMDRWRRLAERGRELVRARVRTSPRNVEVGLLAVPLGGDPGVAGRVVEGVVRESAA
jgi:hypothetical protein